MALTKFLLQWGGATITPIESAMTNGASSNDFFGFLQSAPMKLYTNKQFWIKIYRHQSKFLSCYNFPQWGWGKITQYTPILVTFLDTRTEVVPNEPIFKLIPNMKLLHELALTCSFYKGENPHYTNSSQCQQHMKCKRQETKSKPKLLFRESKGTKINNKEGR